MQRLPSTQAHFRIAFAWHCWPPVLSRNYFHYGFWEYRFSMFFLSPWIIPLAFSKFFFLCPLHRVGGHQRSKEKTLYSLPVDISFPLASAIAQLHAYEKKCFFTPSASGYSLHSLFMAPSSNFKANSTSSLYLSLPLSDLHTFHHIAFSHSDAPVSFLQRNLWSHWAYLEKPG